MKKIVKNQRCRGYLILEALIGIAIIGLLTASVIPTISFLVKRTKQAKFDSQAGILLQQGMEVAYHVLISTPDWSGYTSGVYHPVVSGATWNLLPNSETLETRFTRSVALSDVCRDMTHEAQIVDCPGGTVDAKSKKISVTVVWQEAGVTKNIDAQLLLYKL